MPVLAVWTPEGGLLGAVAPLGLALAASNALVIDLDPSGPDYPGPTSLAGLTAESPSRADLATRPGVAILRNGGIDARSAAKVVEALIEANESVVLRLPVGPLSNSLSHPVVPVRQLLPGGWFRRFDGPAVYQATPVWESMPGPGVRLPIPSPAMIRALLSGRRPAARDKWVAAWRSVWRFEWPRETASSIGS